MLKISTIEEFTEAIKLIPPSHRENLPLWLDHFDTLWLTFTHSIPSATAFNVRPEVSLYDHSRTTAALATALWRWHHEHRTDTEEAVAGLKDRSDWKEPKFLLIQGDFFGIQNFIFASGSQTNKQAAKLLRGRSFYISLLSECAALKVLDVLGLPPTSQVTNAAGKFLIVAPNTSETRMCLEKIKKELDTWFLEHSYGEAGIGLAWLPASCNNFLKSSINASEKESRFTALQRLLFQKLDTAKLQRFNLLGADAPQAVCEVKFAHGACVYNPHWPAKDNTAISELSDDHITIGKAIADKFERLLIITEQAKAEVYKSSKAKALTCDIFGYAVVFTQDEETTGHFSEWAKNQTLRRVWDYSLPESMNTPSWKGYARRNINGYIPRFTPEDMCESNYKYYDVSKEDAGEIEFDRIKTFEYLACENRKPLKDTSEKYQGIKALSVLKGDVDNLGMIFQKGLEQPTFAKMAALSRQMNAFFAVYLPALCKADFPDTYTVFAGGDDFFLIGPWLSIQKLAVRMQQKFKHYVAENEGITFSAGIITVKPGVPVPYLAKAAEAALEQAKKAERKDGELIKNKNAVSCFGEVVPWEEWGQIDKAEMALKQLRDQEGYPLSTGFTYGLLQLTEMAGAEKEKPENALWRSYLAYRTRRLLVEKNLDLKNENAKKTAQERIVKIIGEQGILTLKSKYRVVLFNTLYQQRD